MRKQPAKELKKSINYMTYKINKLRGKIDSCEESGKLYNRLLIERAGARKKLKELESNNLISSMIKKITFKKEEKRICDYFPAS